MFDWLRKSWSLIAVITAAFLICGPLQGWMVAHLGAGFAQSAIIIDNLAAIALILLFCDFILDNRQDWGIFPALDIDAALDTAINGSADESGVRCKQPMACALVFIGVIAMLITILFLAVPRANAGTMDDARRYLPVLSRSLDSNWPAAPLRYIPAGQVEQESSWKANATLKTSRELGRGLVQMTVAYDRDGRERFNIYREAVRYKALSAWDWRRDPYSVTHQLTFLTLQDRCNFDTVRRYCVSDAEAWKCALVCYNAGEGRWLSRMKNARLKGLPTDRWDGGLALAYGKGETAILYGRPLYVAVNEYPRVIFKRAQKYWGLV